MEHSRQRRNDSNHTNHSLREGTQCFFRMKYIFLSCRLLQCIAVSMVLFFPAAAFNHTSKELGETIIDPTHYKFNFGIAGISLLHNFICYVVYFVDEARLPFIIYTALVDFAASNGFLGLLLAAIILGGDGLGVLYKTLCILAWLGFLITSIMETSLVCVFKHLQEQLSSSLATTQQQQLSAGIPETLIPRPNPVAKREKTPHVRKVGRNVTVEAVPDSMDIYQACGNSEAARPLSMGATQSQELRHLSQATTIAEILQEPANNPRPTVS